MALIGTPDEREGGGETRHTSHISTPTGEHATYTHREGHRDEATGYTPSLGDCVCVCIPMRVLVGERGVGWRGFIGLTRGTSALVWLLLLLLVGARTQRGGGVREALMGDADEDVEHRKASPAQCIAAEKQQTTNNKQNDEEEECVHADNRNRI